ncbi:MAG: hypothetical protein AAF570_15295 [Bacteroidota bacterium]
MSKKLSSYFIFLLLTFAVFPAALQAEGVDAQLQTANKAFDSEAYTESLTMYETLYAEGYFTEKMLYRLAFMHENLRNYPQAIYYLKKAAQEYGNTATEAKIKQMMQTQGSTRIFTKDGLSAFFFQLFRNFGVLIWILFGLTVAGIAVLFFWPAKEKTMGRQIASISAWSAFTVLGLLLYYHSFFTPDRAVITEQTAFYNFPSYAAKLNTNAFSIGETVNIVDEEDVWVLVEAGGREWWVPERTVRRL